MPLLLTLRIFFASPEPLKNPFFCVRFHSASVPSHHIARNGRELFRAHKARLSKKTSNQPEKNVALGAYEGSKFKKFDKAMNLRKKRNRLTESDRPETEKAILALNRNLPKIREPTDPPTSLARNTRRCKWDRFEEDKRREF